MIKVFLLFLLLLTSYCSKADSVYLHINGTSKHFGECLVPCNEKNTGVGIEWFSETGHGAAIGTLKNSLSTNSYYSGYIFYTKTDVVKFGALLGILKYESPTGDWWPLIFPVLNVGSDRYSINFTYIPQLSSLTVPAIFMQGRVWLK